MHQVRGRQWACQGELVSPLTLVSKGERENGIAINAKGGDCWKYGITSWHWCQYSDKVGITIWHYMAMISILMWEIVGSNRMDLISEMMCSSVTYGSEKRWWISTISDDGNVVEDCCNVAEIEFPIGHLWCHRQGGRNHGEEETTKQCELT